MKRLAHAGAMVQVAVALGLALVAAPMVRTVTSELNDTVGRAWPFSMARCALPTVPGCRGMAARPAAEQQTAHLGTGRL